MNDIKNATDTTVIKVAVYKDGSLFSALWPHFQRLEQQGILEVVALASEQQGKIVYAFKGQLSSGGGASCRHFPAGSQGLLANRSQACSGWSS